MDTELESWRNAWQSDVGIPAELRRRVQRQTRFLRMMLVLEILVTIVMGGGTALIALQQAQTEYIVLTVATWMFIAAAWTFAALNRRGLWQPVGLTTEAFLEISIRRARSAMAAATFGTVLYFVEIAFCLAWIYRHNHGLEALTLILVGLITAAFLAVITVYRLRKQAELRYLLHLRRSDCS